MDAVNPESFLAGKVSKAVDSAGATIAKSGAIEGSEEMLQSGIEQMLSNLALDKPISEGLGHSTALGLLTGSLVGAGVAGASVSSKKHIDPETNAEYQNNKVYLLLHILYLILNRETRDEFHVTLHLIRQ